MWIPLPLRVAGVSRLGRMHDELKLATIVNRLLAEECGGEPTIEMMEVAVPHLRRLDWINRFGFGAWERIASTLQTHQLGRLVKILIIAEREYDWLGGSVAAPIWLFRAFRERQNSDAHALATWALANRGRNEYIPFGRIISERCLDHWQVERELRPRRRESRHERAQREKDEEARRAEKRARRAEEAAERGKLRKIASRARHMKLIEYVEILRCLNDSERLAYIASRAELPLEFIPHNLVAESIAAAPALDGMTKQLLAKRVDRRNRRIWKQLRLSLDV